MLLGGCCSGGDGESKLADFAANATYGAGWTKGMEAGDFLPAFISRRSGHHTSFCSGTFVFIIGRTFAPSFFVTSSPSKPE